MKLAPFLVAGIINITPDSFSDGGKNFIASQAIASINQMIKEGAGCIDIGAESTRPGAPDIGQQEEQKRLSSLFSLLESFDSNVDACFSLDTYRAKTAQWALEQKAVTVINDISGGQLDPDMAEVISTFKPGYVLGHCPSPPATMQKNPEYKDVVVSLLDHFSFRMNVLVKAGVPEENIALDPCIGFGKNLEHNLQIIREIDKLLELGRPLYFGISKKSLFKELLGIDLSLRGEATQVLTGILGTKGVAIHRVHDVIATVRTLKLVSHTL